MVTKIDTDQVFKDIKKQNGEKVAQVIRGDRDHDGSLLGIPNILHILEFAGHDETEIRQIREVLKDMYLSHKESEYYTQKSPLELLSEAGYDAFVVKTEKQKNSIKQYYRPGEELCTFGDPNRHLNYYMIHAVKRGADKIKPSKTPMREDEYGTSVISIQIAKPAGGFISIKNRYNHTVNNPDATFDNNPDNIIPGLSYALQRYFHVDFSTSRSPLPDNFRMIHDQIVRYNYEIDNVYFGPDYYFSGSNITKLDSNYQVMMDYLILDMKSKTVSSPIQDDTYKVFHEAFDGKTIKKTANKTDKTTTISTPDGNVVVIKDGQIVELNLPNVEKIGKGFLRRNQSMVSLNLPNVKEIGEDFLSFNRVLSHFSAPKLQRTGKDFLTSNTALTELDLPEVTDIEQYSLQCNHNLEKINTPKATYLGHLSSDQPNLKYFYAPELVDYQLEHFYNDNPVARDAIIDQRIEKMSREAKQRQDERYKEAVQHIEKMSREAEQRLEELYKEATQRVKESMIEEEHTEEAKEEESRVQKKRNNIFRSILKKRFRSAPGE